MKNTQSIRVLTRQLSKVSERIESLVDAIAEGDQSGSGVNEVYHPILIDELEHAQMLTLKLTELLVGPVQEEQNADDNGSVFAEGDLNVVKSQKESSDEQDLENSPEEDHKPPFAVGVLVVSDGKVLTGTRLTDNGKGMICGPGGYGIDGESPEAAAKRLTQEKFGILPLELISIGVGAKDNEGLSPLLFLCTRFSGQAECSGGCACNPQFLDVESLERRSNHLFPPFADSLIHLLYELEDNNEDGGSGSGNWGHEGRKGKLGGSKTGGGRHNRLTDESGGFTSFSKNRKKLGKPHKTSYEELSKAPQKTKIITKSGVYEKKTVFGKDLYFDGTGGKVDGATLYQKIQSEDVSLAVPDSSNPNFRKISVVNEGNYTDDRKRNAFTTSVPEEADELLRSKSGAVWQTLDDRSKKALADYTGSFYMEINGDCRNGKFSRYTAQTVNRMTEAITQSKLDRDMYLYRGIGAKALASMVHVDYRTLKTMSPESLVGRVLKDEGFMSCGTAAETGFDHKDVQFKLYAPAGTEALYAEPFSENGDGDGVRWDGHRADGRSRQSSFSSEFETILNRGTSFQITSAKMNGNRYEIEAQIVGQEYKRVKESK